MAEPQNKSDDNPLGLITIDSLFSPVKKVSFTVVRHGFLWLTNP